MLRAVIEKNGQKVDFDFCDSWAVITSAIHRIDKEQSIPNLLMNNNEINICITHYKNEEFEKLALFIQPDDRVEDVFILCQRIKYDDDYKDYFLKHFHKYYSINDVKQDYIHFQAKEINKRVDIQPLEYTDPYSINYEVISLFGNKVLFTPSRIDVNKLPQNIYRYELRVDEKGNICEMSKGILVNHWGTVLSSKKIKLDDFGYRFIDEDKDVTFDNVSTQNLNEYLRNMKNLKNKKKRNEFERS